MSALFTLGEEDTSKEDGNARRTFDETFKVQLDSRFEELRRFLVDERDQLVAKTGACILKVKSENGDLRKRLRTLELDNEEHSVVSDEFAGEQEMLEDPTDEDTEVDRRSSASNPYNAELFVLWPGWLVHSDRHSPTSSLVYEEDDDEEIMVSHSCTLMKHDSDHFRWYVARPDGRTRLIWDITGMIVLLYDLVFIPVQLAFGALKNNTIRVCAWFTMLYWTFDVAASCLTGYVDEVHGVITRPRRIVVRYLTSWFLLDIVILLADWADTMCTILEFNTGTESLEAAGMIRVGKAVRVMRVLRTVRLLRLAKVRHLLSMVQDNLDSEYFYTIVNITKYIVFIIAINHFIACGWRRLGLVHVPGYGSWLERGGIEFRSLEYQYLTSLHWSLTQFTPASMDVQPTNVFERSFAIVVLLFALCVFSSFVSSITSAMTSLRDLGAKHENQSFLLRRYLRERHISRHLSLRIRRFVAFAVGDLKTKGDHVTLLKTLSPLLRLELKTELYMSNLAAHPFFKKITHARSPVLRALCQFALKELPLSHLDVLFDMGGAATAMYWLRVGGMRYDLKGTRKYAPIPFNVGHWCSEQALWTTWEHAGSMTAKGECEVLVLDAKQFREDMLLLPAFATELRNYAVSYVASLNSSMDGSGYVTDLHTNSQTESVMPFLRKGSRTHFCKENLGDVEVDGSLSEELVLEQEEDASFRSLRIFPGKLRRPSIIRSPGR
mmetsp:Transcript_32394/g.86934  ORF Transcript_32394/g.86934 Transcript_32394/m.86934 type:complete len:722 (-) Transcript_32394:101-2266(-)